MRDTAGQIGGDGIEGALIKARALSKIATARRDADDVVRAAMVDTVSGINELLGNLRRAMEAAAPEAAEPDTIPAFLTRPISPGRPYDKLQVLANFMARTTMTGIERRLAAARLDELAGQVRALQHDYDKARLTLDEIASDAQMDDLRRAELPAGAGAH